VSWTKGFELGVGARVTTVALPFLLSVSLEPYLRVLDSKSYAASMLQRVDVGLKLGPVVPEVGGGLSTITVDVVHGHWSAQLLSPRAEAGLFLHLGTLRIGAHAYGEYLWRWWGNTSFLVRGFDFVLGFDNKR
jgi:hypothetical protein